MIFTMCLAHFVMRFSKTHVFTMQNENPHLKEIIKEAPDHDMFKALHYVNDDIFKIMKKYDDDIVTFFGR